MTAAAPPERPRLKELLLDLGDNVTMKLVEILPGTFLMGSPKSEKGRNADEGLAPKDVVNGNTQVRVTISKPYYMGVYEVTVGQYRQFSKFDKRQKITIYGPSSQTYFQLGGIPDFDWAQKEERLKSEQNSDHPVLKVLPVDAQEFCKWLSEKTGRTVRLPSEAQWEYAARAGSTSRFYFGDSDNDLHKYGNYCDKSSLIGFPWQDRKHSDGYNYSAPVGSFKPNAWGLYDMLGNAGEYCRGSYTDHYSATGTTDPEGPFIDPRNPSKSKYFVVRGGCFANPSALCRSAVRERRDSWSDRHNAYDVDGFRVIVEGEAKTAERQR
jgi:formylglycine-generating enzyme required for sulfatase activity